MRKGGRLVAALVVLAVTGVFAWLRFSAHRAPGPLEIGLWYWHRPFRLPANEAAQLRAMGVRRLFVRTGTFQRVGDRVRLALPQQWEASGDGFEIHLVFNFDYDVVRAYTRLSNDALARSVGEAVRSEVARAAKAGVHPAGIQLDFDCPTRLLPRYADLLRRLRPALNARPGGAPLVLSITALPTWFGSRDVQAVLDAADFSVPQYYEARIPKTLAAFATVSQLRMVERGLRAAGRRGRPFYAGLPAYGHALVFDDGGRLMGTFRDMDAREAMRRPGFRLVRAFPADAQGRPAARQTWIGEDIFDFRVPGPDGETPCRLVYDLPTSALLAQHLALVRAQRPAYCRGVVLFRYPEPEETQTLPLPELAAALRGEAPMPHLAVRLETAAAPWELIETGRRAARPPLELSVTVTNTGAASTFLSPEAVTLTLRFDRPGLDAVPPRDFDAAETFFAPASSSPPLRAGPLRANVVRFRRVHLAAGETARIGPIRLPADGPTRVSGTWTALGPGGFDTARGDIPGTPLMTKE